MTGLSQSTVNSKSIESQRVLVEADKENPVTCSFWEAHARNQTQDLIFKKAEMQRKWKVQACQVSYIKVSTPRRNECYHGTWMDT